MQPYAIRQAMSPQTGLILPIILVFLQILVLLILYTFGASVLATKTSHQLWQKELFLSDLTHILQVIEDDISRQMPVCVIAETPLEILQNEPESWWETQSCVGNFHTIHYYYVVEPLGEDLCAHIENAKGQVADYYRISLYGVDNQSGSKILVQSTQVIPLAELQKCTDHVHIVLRGQQTWRLV